MMNANGEVKTKRCILCGTPKFGESSTLDLEIDVPRERLEALLQSTAGATCKVQIVLPIGEIMQSTRGPREVIL